MIFKRNKVADKIEKNNHQENIGSIVTKKIKAKNSQVNFVVNSVSRKSAKILNNELENKFKWIWTQYNEGNYEKWDDHFFNGHQMFPWLNDFNSKDFDDSKYILVDDEHGVEGRPDFTREDINMLIEAKLIKPIKPWGTINFSSCIQVRGIFWYYLILTNKGIMYFEKGEGK